jgi:hypothetical protein
VLTGIQLSGTTAGTPIKIGDVNGRRRRRISARKRRSGNFGERSSGRTDMFFEVLRLVTELTGKAEKTVGGIL